MVHDSLPIISLKKKKKKKKTYILEHKGLQSLADEWALMITNTEVDDDILEHVGLTRAEFDALGQAPPTWMDVVLN